MSIIVDGHEDIAWNTLCFGRDYLKSAHDIRAYEGSGSVEAVTGMAMLGLPEWLKGGLAVIHGTLFTPPERKRTSALESHYNNADEAHSLALQQLEIYERMDDECEQIKLIRTRADLDGVLKTWEDFDPDLPADPRQDERQVGIVCLIENGDSIRTPDEVALWYERGVRLVGPAWAGTRYCGGTDEPGPLTAEGVQLLKHMSQLNMALDLSHMDEQAFFQALDRYDGIAVASHSNPRALSANVNRHLSDDMIKELLAKDGVIGTLIYNRFLLPSWLPGDPKDAATVETVVRAIDYVCQKAGDARHAAIGTDFDGGFGMKSAPAGFDTVADLQIIGPALARRGYSPNDIDSVMSGNWLRVLRTVLR